MELTGRIGEILNKLEALRSVPGSEAWFGVSQHQFRLRPPIAESELLAFEQRHGICLPEEYRQFLLLAGDGGAGPFYGLSPLAEWNMWFEEEDEKPGFLSTPCPLTDCEATRLAWKAAQARDQRRRQGIVKVGSLPNDAWKPYLPNRWEEMGKGTINLADQGCTYSARLIVTGEARGRIVYMDVQGWYPPYFVKDLGFLDWYERWLAMGLRGEAPDSIGFDNPDY